MNPLKNILKLIKALFFIKNLDWSLIGEIQKNCTIDKTAKLYSPNFMTRVQVGAFSYIGPNGSISLTKIGRYCSIGPNLICGRGIHPVDGISTSPMFYSMAKQNGITLSKSDKIEERKEIMIGNDVYIGSNVTILDGITIGDGVIIGAGAVVTKNIEPYAIVGGVPARLIKYRFSEEEIMQFLAIKWWDWPAGKLDEIEKQFFDVPSFLKKHTNDSQ